MVLELKKHKYSIWKAVQCKMAEPAGRRVSTKGGQEVSKQLRNVHGRRGGSSLDKILIQTG
jgi:hypothetical protein